MSEPDKKFKSMRFFYQKCTKIFSFQKHYTLQVDQESELILLNLIIPSLFFSGVKVVEWPPHKDMEEGELLMT